MPGPLVPLAIAARVVLFGAGLVAGAWGLGKLTQKGERQLFNKGVCPKCDGHFKRIEGTQGDRGYRCDYCSNVVWISFGADDGYEYSQSRKSKEFHENL